MMKYLTLLTMLALCLSACSKAPEMTTEVSEDSRKASLDEAVLFDTWEDISVDHPGVVAVAEWRGYSVKEISQAQVKVTRDFDFFLITRDVDGVSLAEKIGRPRWSVVDAEKGIIARNHEATGYQLIDRMTEAEVAEEIGQKS